MSAHSTPFSIALETSGLSGAELARRVGVKRSTISHAAAGRHRLGPKTRARIAALLGIDIAILFPENKDSGRAA